jgi:membrane protease YdiL (CAAX protease family)
MEKKKTYKMELLGKTWSRLPVVIRAIVTGFAVSTVGVATWALMGTTLPLPWPFILMLAFLWAYLRYFSGHWGSKSSIKNRAIRFRRTTLPRRIWMLSLLAAAMIVLIEQSGMVVTFRIMEFPADKFLQEYGFIESIPTWAGWLVIIMISAVAGICEETGFRGYMQVPLEKRYSPLVSISLVSVVFVLVHLHQAWSGPVIIHIFFISVLFGSIAYYSGSLIPGIIAHFIMDICNFSFWWTDLGGQFNKETLAQTGLDSHFILWLAVLVLSLTSFIFILRSIDRRKYETAI